jgi:RNA polymerase sigma-70 factor (ECF subfamily)
MLETWTDAQLITRFQSATGDERTKILLILYDRYRNLILKICRHYLKSSDLPYDAFHDTFIKIARNLDKLQNPEAFKGWAMRITRNVCVDYLRKTSLTNENIEEESVVRVSSIDMEEVYIAEINRKNLLLSLKGCMQLLRPFDLRVLDLRWRGLKTGQITKILNIDKQELRRSYDRIKKGLENCMGKKGLRISIDEILSFGGIDG